MTAKMPMSGSPEKRRDCIDQLPLRSPIFTLALNLNPIRFRHQQVVHNVSTSRRVPCPRGSPTPGEGAGRHPREFARAFRRPETFGVPYYLIQFLEQLNLLINQQLE